MSRRLFMVACPANPNARNEVGVTAFWEAARTGRLPIVKELVARHADVSARVIPRVGGDTPLMCAANFGHADVAKFLVLHGADPHARAFLMLMDRHSRNARSSLRSRLG